MKNFNVIKNLVLLMILISSCNGVQTISQYNAKVYNESLSEFDSTFVNNFPKKEDAKRLKKYDIVMNKNIDKNMVGLLLYSYDTKPKTIDSLIYEFSNKAIEKYSDYDTCLLIVDRFETKNTSENRLVPTINDSTLINKECYNSKFPIPNFVDYNGDNKTECGLDSTFTIYVLEAKPGIYFEKYQKKPFAQMPKKWANGYSKGIAISRKDKTVIYWSIIW